MDTTYVLSRYQSRLDKQMKIYDELTDHTVHLWRASLSELSSQETFFWDVLSDDERDRANRFHFPIHKTRFIIARGVLRNILGLYTDLPAAEIIFEYGKHGKPSLKNNSLKLQFNVSHSDDVAVYAITKGAEIGVDIEKISAKSREDIAKRFFSDKENQTLSALPEEQRVKGFYQIWAGKEALIKAVGEGLYVPLGDFSVALDAESQVVELTHNQVTEKFFLQNFSVHPEYCSAIASAKPIKHLTHWEWNSKGCGLIESW